MPTSCKRIFVFLAPIARKRIVVLRPDSVRLRLDRARTDAASELRSRSRTPGTAAEQHSATGYSDRACVQLRHRAFGSQRPRSRRGRHAGTARARAAPTRRRAHLCGLGGALRDAVAKRSHVMRQQVRMQLHLLAIERRGLVRSGRHRRRVTAVASDLREHLLARSRGGRQRHLRRRREKAHEVREVINVGLPVTGSAKMARGSARHEFAGSEATSTGRPRSRYPSRTRRQQWQLQELLHHGVLHRRRLLGATLKPHAAVALRPRARRPMLRAKCTTQSTVPLCRPSQAYIAEIRPPADYGNVIGRGQRKISGRAIMAAV